MISFVYTILLFLLYACAISSSFYAWMNTKHKSHLVFIAVFTFFLADLSIISIIEFICQTPINLSTSPNNTFPEAKFISLLIGIIIYTFLFLFLLETPFKLRYLIPPILFVCISALTPIFFTGILADWCYYAGRYISLITLLLLFLRQIYRSKDTQNTLWHFILKLNLTMLGFMSASFLEVTITLIYWKTYSQWLSSFAPKLTERIFTEDIYSIALSVWYISQCYRIVRDKFYTTALSGEVSTSLSSGQFSHAKEKFSAHLALTKRECEILDLLLKNKTNQEITEELFISLGTAKTHVHNILQKANVTKRTQLMEAFKTFVMENRENFDLL